MKDRLFSLRFKLRDGNVSITAYDCGEPVGPHGHTTIRCALAWRGEKLFTCVHSSTPCGMTVGIPAGQCIDEDYAKEAVAALFCLKPGDTDADFFRDYTPAQLDWVTSYGEELYMAKCDRFGWES